MISCEIIDIKRCSFLWFYVYCTFCVWKVCAEFSFFPAFFAASTGQSYQSSWKSRGAYLVCFSWSRMHIFWSTPVHHTNIFAQLCMWSYWFNVMETPCSSWLKQMQSSPDFRLVDTLLEVHAFPEEKFVVFISNTNLNSDKQSDLYLMFSHTIGSHNVHLYAMDKAHSCQGSCPPCCWAGLASLHPGPGVMGMGSPVWDDRGPTPPSGLFPGSSSLPPPGSRLYKVCFLTAGDQWWSVEGVPRHFFLVQKKWCFRFWEVGYSPPRYCHLTGRTALGTLSVLGRYFDKFSGMTISFCETCFLFLK